MIFDLLLQYTIKHTIMKTKRFDFKRQLKDLDLNALKQFREVHVNYMLSFIGYNEKEADKHSRYVGYIDNAIQKIENKH